MNPLLRRITWHLRRRRKEAELDDELRFHLEEEAAERETAGLPPASARRAARLDFGNPAVVKEDARAAWTSRVMEQNLQDLRYAIRAMRRSPAFTLLACLSLALGIGANAALFSVLDAVLLRSLPVRDPGSLVRMTWRARQSEAHGLSYHDSAFTDAAGYTDGVFSYPAFELLRARTAVFAAVFAYQGTGPVALGFGGDTEAGTGEYVSGGYFAGLGVAAPAGRLLVDADDRVGTAPVVVISSAWSTAHFTADGHAIGQTLFINRKPFTIVGVAPREFFGTDPGVSPDVYLPLHANVLLDERAYSPPASRYADASRAWLEVMARLQPGVGLARAQAEAAPVFQQLSDAVKASGRWSQAPSLVITPGARGIDGVRRAYESPLLLLIGLAGLILILACVNIANLLLARASVRARELAVRASLGAGRKRVMRQLLTESLALSCTAGAAGLIVAVWSERAISALMADAQGSALIHAGLAWRVVAVALGLSVFTGVTFGLAPALQSSRGAVLPALKEGRTGGSSSQRASRFQRALLASQVAIALVLVASAGLFLRTVANYGAIDLGFSADHVLTVSVRARLAGLDTPSAIAWYGTVRERLRAIPGVLDVGLSDLAPIGDGRAFTTVTAPGREVRDSPMVLSVDAGFFSTMSMRIVRGRTIEARDERAGATPIAVIDETFARTRFGTSNPLGQHLTVPNDSPAIARLRFEIVGIAANARLGRLTGDREATVYLPFTLTPFAPVDRMVLEVRTAADSARYVNVVRAALRDVNPNVPVTRVASQAALVDGLFARQIVTARLCVGFALLALAIAGIGLYASVLYNVSGRRAEIGIRMALGARQGQVIRLVLREVLVVVGAGVLIGAPVAFAVARAADSLLFGVGPGDPTTIAATLGLLVAAGLLAGYLPARSASRVNPTAALKSE